MCKMKVQPGQPQLRCQAGRSKEVRTTTLCVPATTIVNSALSMFRPTARDSMLAPERTESEVPLPGQAGPKLPLNPIIVYSQMGCSPAVHAHAPHGMSAWRMLDVHLDLLDLHRCCMHAKVACK